MENLSMAETMQQQFKRESLQLLREQIANGPYLNYPTERLWIENDSDILEPFFLPDGDWETSDGTVPSIQERQLPELRHCRHDGYGRPLHPWFIDMITDSEIGVVTGKGAYWRWGPNYTADAIIVRHDRPEPEVLLIKRKDTGKWALPGGFIDDGESAFTAALREAKEETGLILTPLNLTITPVYNGPLADLRVTANAWPETTAYRFDLFDGAQLDAVQGADDALAAEWIPATAIQNELFGSHKLLIQLAFQN